MDLIWYYETEYILFASKLFYAVSILYSVESKGYDPSQFLLSATQVLYPFKLRPQIGGEGRIPTYIRNPSVSPDCTEPHVICMNTSGNFVTPPILFVDWMGFEPIRAATPVFRYYLRFQPNCGVKPQQILNPNAMGGVLPLD